MTKPNVFATLTQPQARKLYVMLTKATVECADAYTKHRTAYSVSGHTTMLKKAKDDLRMIMDIAELKKDLQPLTRYAHDVR